MVHINGPLCVCVSTYMYAYTVQLMYQHHSLSLFTHRTSVRSGRGWNPSPPLPLVPRPTPPPAASHYRSYSFQPSTPSCTTWASLKRCVCMYTFIYCRICSSTSSEFPLVTFSHVIGCLGNRISLSTAVTTVDLYDLLIVSWQLKTSIQSSNNMFLIGV